MKDNHEDYETEIQFVHDGQMEYYAIYMSYLANDSRCVGTFRNMTDEKEKEERLRKQAQIDSLTKLYNRATGEEKIRSLLQGDKTHALVLIDLDDFKKINDTLGHDYGDKVLRDVSRELKHHFRKEDIICR